MDYPAGDLTIDKDGLARLDEWRKRCDPEDALAVGRMLRDISKRQWQGVWWAQANVSKPGVTTFQPREGLFVHIRLWADEADQFTIEGFSDTPPGDSED
jgi:hypothetical protein